MTWPSDSHGRFIFSSHRRFIYSAVLSYFDIPLLPCTFRRILTRNRVIGRSYHFVC